MRSFANGRIWARLGGRPGAHRVARLGEPGIVGRVVQVTLRNALVIIGGVAFLVCWPVLYFPLMPHSVTGWALFVGLGLPVCMMLEWLGEAVLGSRFFARRSSTFRIVVGVPVCIALVAVGMICAWFVRAAVLAAG